MTGEAAAAPNYGNWASKNLLYGLTALAVALLALSFFSLVLLIGVAVLVAVIVNLLYQRHEFTSSQQRVWDRVVEHLDWDGKGRAIDVGCGNGPVAIRVAKMFPNASVVGIDTWGKVWEYSKATCEENAKVEGVGGRVSFQRASGSKLPFEDGYFDAAVSNLAFHEIRDVGDKRMVMQEALRVVRKGGSFSFQDLFNMKRYYGGGGDELLEVVRSWGVEKVSLIRTDDPSIPKSLGKQIAIICGVK